MIRVNERWIIQVDEYNYVVCQNKPKLSTKEGKEYTTYPAKGYFRGLPEALRFIFNEEVRISLADGEKSLLEAVDAISRVRDELGGQFDAILGGAE